MRLPLAGIFLLLSSIGAVGGEARLPVDLPPPGYSGAVFVDANGCAFARAEIGSMQIWVMQLDRTGRPVCGKEPTDWSSDVRPRVAAAEPWRSAGG